jgi:hypothetical protein
MFKQRSPYPSSKDETEEEFGITHQSTRTEPFSEERFAIEPKLERQRTKPIPVVPTRTANGIILVD